MGDLDAKMSHMECSQSTATLTLSNIYGGMLQLILGGIAKRSHDLD